MTGEPVTTLHDFQLSMLHPMCRSAPAQAAELLDRIGATRADTAIAEARWWFGNATNNFTTITEYVSAWGAPDSENIEGDGARETRSARWDLPFWPGMQFEFTAIGRYPRLFHRLLRQPGVPVPQLDSIDNLTPWSCTQAEFLNSGLGPFDQDIDLGSIGNRIDFEAVDPESGRRRPYRALFDWGLLQSVEPVLVRLSKPNPAPVAIDETPIDELILTGQTGRAVLRIHAEIEGNGYAAIAEYQLRHARLARERPNDFVLDEPADRLSRRR
ncbi:MAG: hypothetical protein JWN03_4987 [Nocardia sp.]|uniref:hypothetical protein n=1 Tax=Nocardia sp. TaxID=1821 RepID=UPI002607B7FB|nr:hypothetical protein [Nocardia sp.]MCU1644712.1 hypothetical protein [Nocardia sp.]